MNGFLFRSTHIIKGTDIYIFLASFNPDTFRCIINSKLKTSHLTLHRETMLGYIAQLDLNRKMIEFFLMQIYILSSMH